jgi:hypothetical protein
VDRNSNDEDNSTGLNALSRPDKVPKKLEYQFSRYHQFYSIKYTDIEKGQWPLICH